jgi:hypothetical protein
MSLDDNMRFALEAVGYVRQAVPRSANYKLTSSALVYDGKPLQMHTARDQDLLRLRGRYGKAPALTSKDEWWAWACRLIKKVLAKGIGNCGELALVAIHYLSKKGVSNLDFVYIVDGVTNNAVLPHVVAVLGRQGNQTGNIGLPNQWGGDAVVCDPWDRVVYPAKKYAFYWTGLKSHSQNKANLTCNLEYRRT